MRISIRLDFEDGTGELRKDIHIPERIYEDVTMQPTPDGFWYAFVKGAHELLRQWAYAKSGKPEKMKDWRPLSDEWYAPMAKMIAAAREAP